MLIGYMARESLGTPNLGYSGGRHGSYRGLQFDGGTKIAREKLKFVIYSFLNLYFTYNHLLQSCINTALSSDALSRPCGVSPRQRHQTL